MMRRRRSLERIFRFSLWAKALDGAIEIVGGGLLLLTSSAAMLAFVSRLTVHELTEDPTDPVANAILSLGQQLGAIRVFGALYLLTHGVVKLVLVAFLLRGNLRAYPWAIAVLSLFAFYQTYLTWARFSYALLGLTVLDFVIVVLALHEYAVLRAARSGR